MDVMGAGPSMASNPLGGGQGMSQTGGMQGFNQANVQSVQFPNLVPQMNSTEQGQYRPF